MARLSVQQARSAGNFRANSYSSVKLIVAILTSPEIFPVHFAPT
ncbi:MAG TPA: hypothetical protein VK892_19725 [Pyrinomonadaceae bacterium]|nr:hypothetical protein [Pyrinomonadaceae bacterium]